MDRFTNKKKAQPWRARFPLLLLTSTIGKKLLNFINTFLRKILNIHLPKIISNDELWKQAQQSRLGESITLIQDKGCGLDVRSGSLRIISSFRHSLILLWFADLMNVTEEVTIHRP